MATHAHITGAGTMLPAALPPSRQALRRRLEAAIEDAIAALDAFDGDPDREPSEDLEPDDDDCCEAWEDQGTRIPRQRGYDA